MRSPRRILYLDNTPTHANLYGAEQSLLELVRGLDRRRFAPHAIVSSRTLAEALEASGASVQLHRLRRINVRGLRSLSSYCMWLTECWRVVRRVDPHLVHANNVWFNPYAALAGAVCRVPSVCHVRNQFGRPDFWRYGLFLSSAIVATSPSAAAPWRTALRRGQHLRVVYNGVDTDRFRFEPTWRQASRAELGVDHGEMVIAMVAQLSRWKRQDIFVRALAQASHEVDRCVGLLVGCQVSPQETAYVEELHAAVRRFRLVDRIKFTGSVRDMPRLYPAVDVLVLCSDDREGCPRSVLEAMAAERPVIATATGGARELVRDGKTGLLVPVGDAAALADAMVTLARDAGMRRKMGIAAREQVQERFSVQQYAAKVQGVYDRILRDTLASA